MAVREIVKIDEEKCNGCGLCVPNCAEGAIQVINGKANLVSEIYCDGLGACLGHCPQGAITIEKRSAKEFDEQATNEHLKKLGNAAPMQSTHSAAQAHHAPAAPHSQFHGCPGAMARELTPAAKGGTSASAPRISSELAQWPVQLALVNPSAPFFKNADLLIAADCAPFAYANFHSDLLKGKVLAIGCPKLDDTSAYVEKLADLFKNGSIKSVTIAHMEVPCCFGLEGVVETAVRESGKKIPVKNVILSLQGERMDAD